MNEPTENQRQDAPDQPHLVVVASGKGGVGKTTIAANLALTLASFGRRVALLDANYALGDVATLLGLDPDSALDDLLRGQRAVGEVYTIGPLGLILFPSTCGSPDLAELTNEQEERLFGSLAEMGEQSEILVVDCPTGLGSGVRAWLQRASEIVVPITPDLAALADAYALIKLAARLDTRARIHVIANAVASDAEGEEIHQRLRLAAREFLGVDVEALATIPLAPEVTAAARNAMPFAIAAPKSAPSRGLRRAARRLLSQVETGKNHRRITVKSLAATAAR